MAVNSCLIINAGENSWIHEYGMKPILDQTEVLDVQFLDLQEQTPAIFRRLYDAHILIIDLTSGDDDLYYLAGVCHSRALRTILICEATTSVDSLLSDYPIVTYEGERSSENLVEFQKAMQVAISAARADEYRPTTPVEEFFPANAKRPIMEMEHENVVRENRRLKRKIQVFEIELDTLRRSAFYLPTDEKMEDIDDEQNRSPDAGEPGISFRRVEQGQSRK